MWWALEAQIARHITMQDLVLYFNRSRFDETPLPVKSQGGSAFMRESKGTMGGSGPSSDMECALATISQVIKSWTPMLSEKSETKAS